jgi:hypothetical protein
MKDILTKQIFEFKMNRFNSSIASCEYNSEKQRFIIIPNFNISSHFSDKFENELFKKVVKPLQIHKEIFPIYFTSKYN